jgi:hypothetical protein
MLFDNKRLSKFAWAQIQINATGTKFYFPDQPNLRGKRIQKITAYFYGLYLRNPDNIQLVQSGALRDGFFIGYVNGREDIKIPLYHLVTQTGLSADTFYTNNGYIPLFELPIVWEKSYVLIPNSYALTAPQEVFMFGVFYQD